MRLRRLSTPVLAFAAGAVLTPAVAMAATAIFTSSTTTPAVRAVNTSAQAPAVQAEASGIGNAAAVYGRNTAFGELSNAFYGRSYVTSGRHFGMWGLDSSPNGAGVRGESTDPIGRGVEGSSAWVGIEGAGGSIGVRGTGTASDGIGVMGVGGLVAGVWSSGDLVVDGHLAAVDGSIAGACTLAAGEIAKTCSFPSPFRLGLLPQVVVTPNGNPGGSFWVSGVTASAFTVNIGSAAGAGGLTFTYVVVGLFGGDAGTPLRLPMGATAGGHK